MHHPTDRMTHTKAFVTPAVEHWLEREIAQWYSKVMMMIMMMMKIILKGNDDDNDDDDKCTEGNNAIVWMLLEMMI